MVSKCSKLIVTFNTKTNNVIFQLTVRRDNMDIFVKEVFLLQGGDRSFTDLKVEENQITFKHNILYNASPDWNFSIPVSEMLESEVIGSNRIVIQHNNLPASHFIPPKSSVDFQHSSSRHARVRSCRKQQNNNKGARWTAHSTRIRPPG